MSTAVPPMPADPWCMRIRECAQGVPLAVGAGRQQELACAARQPEGEGGDVVGDRAASRRGSRASPGTDPPGELIQRLMSARGSSAESRKSWEQRRVPPWSSSSPSRTMIRCSRSRLGEVVGRGGRGGLVDSRMPHHEHRGYSGGPPSLLRAARRDLREGLARDWDAQGGRGNGDARTVTGCTAYAFL